MGIFASGRSGTGHRIIISVLIVASYVIGCGGGTGSENFTASIMKL